MEKLTHIHSTTIVLPQTDIDTDQIMPGRFLTSTTREGLSEAIFADWRYDVDGQPLPDFALNQPGAADCQVLVAGNNFGCGSSREHAPWGLVDFGFRAVISTRFADIFSNNSLKNGLVPVVINEDTHNWLLEHPGAMVDIDVAAATLSLPNGVSLNFPLDGFAQHCLLEGLDQLGYLQSKESEISHFEQVRPWKP
ncbi:MAG: 3-isopropylmalate dehydratase small subunit [Gammaproteobacteria bacterium]|jgi:3-isopropylmalate/(R)-2-methylmalate dehydratase small subunit|nr:3-isopropylmalate dehydratase small subunit [Chromatiales bacterium]MDP6675555.1 3-isopropylmalate dehydratase small subunit [Gammaproteobacteria bacterium]